MRNTPVLFINREISSFQRMMEIIHSMPKPQVRYQVDTGPFGKDLVLEAQNKNGICLYSFKILLKFNDKEITNILLDMPQNMFTNKFI